MTKFNQLTEAQKAIFIEAVESAQSFIAKLQEVQICANGFVCAFPETNVCFQPDQKGGWDVVSATHALPMSLVVATRNCKRVTNGHNEHPVVMSHAEFVAKEIEAQQNMIDGFSKVINN